MPAAKSKKQKAPMKLKAHPYSSVVEDMVRLHLKEHTGYERAMHYLFLSLCQENNLDEATVISTLKAFADKPGFGITYILKVATGTAPMPSQSTNAREVGAF